VHHASSSAAPARPALLNPIIQMSPPLPSPASKRLSSIDLIRDRKHLPQDRYAAMAAAASKYGVLQYGITLFTWAADKGAAGQWVASPFNFFLFPEGRDTDVVLNADSIAFLKKHGMDFQKWIYQGVPFVNGEGEVSSHGASCRRPPLLHQTSLTSYSTRAAKMPRTPSIPSALLPNFSLFWTACYYLRTLMLISAPSHHPTDPGPHRLCSPSLEQARLQKKLDRKLEELTAGPAHPGSPYDR